ncbi:MAG: hypothetical protein HY816_02445 [Candidatus Wallbacteria bacterium]|nr:hypothetical protein [Candidatus Wallbacteria bacterium]
MNFYLIPGDNEAPITHVAISADSGRALCGTSAGSLLCYALDGNPPEELARPRPARRIAGLAFAGRGREAIALAGTGRDSGDILKVHPSGGVELLYADAPFEFGGFAMSAGGDFGLISAGGQLLKYFSEQRSYLPVETPEGLLLGGIAFGGADGRAAVAGACQAGGFVARYEPRPETGRLALVDGMVLPALTAVAWEPKGTAFLAGGRPRQDDVPEAGALAWVADGKAPETLPGPRAAVVHGIAFHPSEPWALLATGPAVPTETGARLYRFDARTRALESLYEGPPGAGAFLAVAFSPDSARALVGTEWGQLLEVSC